MNMNEWLTSTFSGGDCCVETQYRTSSYCAVGDCVEVGYKTSSFSGGAGCVEVAMPAAEVLVRDTKDRTRPPIAFSPPAWAAFTAAVRTGEFGPLP